MAYFLSHMVAGYFARGLARQEEEEESNPPMLDYDIWTQPPENPQNKAEGETKKEELTSRRITPPKNMMSLTSPPQFRHIPAPLCDSSPIVNDKVLREVNEDCAFTHAPTTLKEEESEPTGSQYQRVLCIPTPLPCNPLKTAQHEKKRIEVVVINDSDNETESKTTCLPQQPPVSKSRKEDKCTYPNTIQNEDMFCWRSNDSKEVKQCWTRYYKCLSKGCTAKRKVTEYAEDDFRKKHYGSHNHEPPEKTRVSKEMKSKTKEYLSVTAKPTVIQQKFMNEAPRPIKKDDVPTLSQICDWKYQINKEKLPTSMPSIRSYLCEMTNIIAEDMFHNLSALYGENFMCLSQFDPLCLVFMSNFGAAILRNSTVGVVDGTFNIGSGKYILTTIMGFYKNIAIPCAYMISSERNELMYMSYYRVVQYYTDDQFRPEGVLMDFETALTSAWKKVFPGCSLWRDFFHFKQVIIRRLVKEKLSHRIADVVADVHLMWESPSMSDFTRNVERGFERWRDIPQFSNYFRSTWLTFYPPETWARFSRPSDACTGSNCVESNNNRFQNTVFNYDVRTVEQIVKSLWKEDNCQSCKVGSEFLWNEKKKRHNSAALQHAKKRARKNSLPFNQQDSSQNLTSPPPNSVSDDEMEREPETLSPTISEDPCDLSDINLAPDYQQTLSAESPPILDNATRVETHTSGQVENNLTYSGKKQCSCGRSYVNKKCRLGKCKHCCRVAYEPCDVTDHKRAKVGAPIPYSSGANIAPRLPPPSPQPLPDFVARIERAMAEHQDLFIAYSGGTTPGDHPRKITPLNWVRANYTVKAMCHLRKAERSFKVGCITRMEDETWE